MGKTSKDENPYKKKIDQVIKECPSLVVAAKDQIDLLKCGAVDVHKKELVAAACITSTETLAASYYVEKFSAMNSSISDMAKWFKKYEVTDVLMESTGKYWIPVYDILEAEGIKPTVTHPKYVKQIKGKKTDIRDAIHMANMFRSGHVISSFIPPAEIRDIRDLCRYRLKLNRIRTSEKNRFQNSMTVSQVRLDIVLSDPFGKTASEIMEYLINEDPEKVSDEEILKRVDRRVKRTGEEILESIHGFSFPEAQRAKMKVILNHMASIDDAIKGVDDALKMYEKKYESQISILTSIPGIKHNSALYIIGEIGVDMSVWNSAESFCSWAGVVPENNASANKKKSTRIGKGGHYLKPLLVQCALAATKTTYYKYKYERIRQRRGHHKAVIAIAHSMLQSIYYMLRDNEYFAPTDLEQVKEKSKKGSNAEPESDSLMEALAVLKKQGLSTERINEIFQEVKSTKPESKNTASTTNK